MVVDKRAGMDRVTANLEFLDANAIKFGWIANPDPFSPGSGRGSDKKKNDKGRSENVTVARVARAHELSLGNLDSVQPPRSVLIAVVEQKTVEIEEATFEFIGPAVEGEIDAEDGMKLLGEFVVDLSKRRYQTQGDGTWKPISDERKKQKRRAGRSGNQARVNYGQELNSLRYEIGEF